MDLVVLWAGLVALVMILYVVLDGISLGVGLLFPTAREESEKDILMGSIAPVWDANQTWLVFGGGAIFASFPVVYGVLSSALYIPLVAFLAGLIFRGVAFEFRASGKRKGPWDKAFFLGSLVAVFSQGLTLGGILSGISVKELHFAGGPFDWLNPFSLMVGVALMPGYILLASCYLIIKTSGSVQQRAYQQARKAAWGVIFFMAVVTVWTPVHYPLVMTNWFSIPRIYYVWAFPVLGLVCFGALLRSLKKKQEKPPLIWAVGIFLSGYLGLAVSFYPFAIPPTVTLWEAASQKETLSFLLWGAVIVLPVVVGYLIYSYAVFRGKVSGELYGH
ncbi:MAG: cytochrome d ubiquinol oxidase subunit II [bacterium]